PAMMAREGVLEVLWGDPPLGDPPLGDPQVRYYLAGDDGRRERLFFDTAPDPALAGRRVRVAARAAPGSAAGGAPAWLVSAVTAAELPPRPPVLGTRPFVTLVGDFRALPPQSRPLDFFRGM